MKFSTTDGKEYEVADQCGFCQLDTAGNHEPKCPVNRNVWILRKGDERIVY